jgi:mycothiol synthase
VTFQVDWAEQSARAYPRPAQDDVPVVVRHYAALPDASAQRLLAEQGYASGRSFHVMEMALDEEPSPAKWPDGVSVRTFDPGRDEAATYEIFKTSFEDHWSSMITPESFREMTEEASFDPDLWHLAFAGEEMVGICFSKLIDDSGWVEDIGVRPEWRRHGVGLALLRHAFGVLHWRGAQAVGLSVDAQSTTGAPRLFERAGMQVKRSYVLYRKALRS